MSTNAMRTVALSLFAANLSLVAPAKDYYVDADNGNDVWNGLAATKGGIDPQTNLTNGPRKTLQGVLAVANNRWATIHAAPGRYDKGSYEGSGAWTNYFARAYLGDGQTLIATEGPDKTFIEGRSDTSEAKLDNYGNGPSALRCLTLSGGAKVIGFTICGGRVRSRNDSGTDTMSSRGGGILFIGDGYVVDCVISNNASANRGGAAYHEGSAAWDKAVLLNCRVLNNASAKPCAATMYCTQINCLFKDNVGYDHVGYGCALNCTIFDGVRKSTVSNSYIAAGADRGSNKFGGCHYVTGSTPGNSSVYTGCADRPAADYVFAPDGMPLKGSPLVDAVADTSFYDATWPPALADYKGKDAIGGARILGGKMDIGAVEYDWVRAPPAGLSVSVDTTGGSNVVSFARTFPSKDAVVKSLTFAGETFEFADVDDDFVYTRTIEGRAQDYGISVAYAKDEWYVDDDGSDDANVGFRKGSPFGTIKKAMGVVSSGGIVHVAPGIYGDRQGLMDVRGGTTNRVVVKAGVGLVADGGPDATAIVGHRSADAGGWGSDAVRCVFLEDGAYIQGFTIRGGAAYMSSDNGNCGGGVSADSQGNSAIVDCVITNNTAVRGGGVYRSTCIRCLIKDNQAASWSYGTGGFTGEYVDCVADGETLYTSALVLNCSVYRDPDRPNSGMILGIQDGGQTVNTILYDGFGPMRRYSNCVFRADTSLPPEYRDSHCKVDQPEADSHDAAYRPLTAENSVVVDKGWRDAYDAFFPAQWQRFKTGLDACGGQRVYNGALDIGAGEYDWRPTYADRLVGRRGRVVAASSAVVEGAHGVALGSGESLTVDWVAPRAGMQSFAADINGGGTLAVRLNGVPLAPRGGLYSFEAEAGSVSRLEISFTGEGSAEILEFSGEPVGLRIVVK